MSKFEHILASNGRPTGVKHSSAIKRGPARTLLLVLTILLIAVAFWNQPQIQSAVQTVLGQIPGL